MKDGFLKAAAAAPKIRVADPAWNALEICKALDSCYAQRAKLIVLPELWPGHTGSKKTNEIKVIYLHLQA